MEKFKCNFTGRILEATSEGYLMMLIAEHAVDECPECLKRLESTIGKKAIEGLVRGLTTSGIK